MKRSPSNSSPRSGATGPIEVHYLRTGKIQATQNSATEIRRSVGVRASEVKVAEKALRLVLRPSETSSEVRTTKVVASKQARFSSRSGQTGSRTAKNR